VTENEQQPCQHCNSPQLRRGILHSEGLVMGERVTFFVPFFACEECGHERREQAVVGPPPSAPYERCIECSALLAPGFIEHRIEPLDGKPQVVPTRVQACLECGREERHVVFDDPTVQAMRSRNARYNAIKKACHGVLTIAREAYATKDRASLTHLRHFVHELRAAVG
jgi:RNase P subunit RPR2